jgi:hypothetical protein
MPSSGDLRAAADFLLVQVLLRATQAATSLVAWRAGRTPRRHCNFLKCSRLRSFMVQYFQLAPDPLEYMAQIHEMVRTHYTPPCARKCMECVSVACQVGGRLLERGSRPVCLQFRHAAHFTT